MNSSSKFRLILQSVFIIIFVVIYVSCNFERPQVLLSDSIPAIDSTREANILTAFFGLDNGLTQAARILYRNAPGQDGMPVVFSHELDPTTLNGSDFEVTTRSGDKYVVEAATLLPANEEFELRTVLLIGEYGNHPDNPPVKVKVVNDLISRTGHNYIGDEVEVIPLEDGPILSYAEYYSFNEDYPYVAEGRGCDCPKDKTIIIVKCVWSGGVRAINGKELGMKEIDDFQVTLIKGTDTLQVTPFQLADLDDNDNNIDLCLKESGWPILVRVNQNVAIDPRDDMNPETSVPVVSRW